MGTNHVAADVRGAASGGPWDSVGGVCGGQLAHRLRTHTVLHARGGEYLTSLPAVSFLLYVIIHWNDYIVTPSKQPGLEQLWCWCGVRVGFK